MAEVKVPSNNSMRVGCLITLFVVSSLFPLAALAWFGITWLIPSSTPSFDLGTSSITLTGVPGKTVAFGLHSKSYGGYWASNNGLTLTLQDGNSFQVVQPVNQSWGDSLTVCVYGPCPTDDVSYTDLTIPINFTLPGSYAAGTRLNGTLTGDVISPQRYSDGFTNNETDLNIPVTVRVIAHPLPSHHGKPLFGFSPHDALSWLGYGLFALICAMLLLSIPSITRPLYDQVRVVNRMTTARITRKYWRTPVDSPRLSDNASGSPGR